MKRKNRVKLVTREGAFEMRALSKGRISLKKRRNGYDVKVLSGQYRMSFDQPNEDQIHVYAHGFQWFKRSGGLELKVSDDGLALKNLKGNLLLRKDDLLSKYNEIAVSNEILIDAEFGIISETSSRREGQESLKEPMKKPNKRSRQKLSRKSKTGKSLGELKRGTASQK